MLHKAAQTMFWVISLGEDSFFNALAHIMWDMEVDIFAEREKTLALVSDFVPKCKRQYNRLKAMYECGAMDEIERAVSDKEEYAEHMWQAADLLCDRLSSDEKKAVFAVNQIIALWDGELPELDDSDSDEDEIEKEEDEMLFLQDVAEEENAGQSEQESAPAEGGEEQAQESSAEPVLKRLVRFWCESDCEQGRPHLVTCPIGWIIMIVCAALGVFMIYDIPLGDKLVAPSFVFMFAVLLGKRQYRYESVGRLSLVIGVFYLAAGARALWLGSTVALRCLPIIAAALVVFNNGRFSVLLDGEKRRPALGYLLIIIMSAAVTAGVYAIQNVQL